MIDANHLIVLSLTDNCPNHMDNEDCPVSNIRNYNPEERSKAVDEMSDEEISNILTIHKNCGSQMIG
ncbi:MAG: hypothetical protein ACYTFY_12105 [Planctomycetota bacterium]|jgi:hypothetical protein